VRHGDSGDRISKRARRKKSIDAFEERTCRGSLVFASLARNRATFALRGAAGVIVRELMSRTTLARKRTNAALENSRDTKSASPPA
jgi:hypothetical protein